MSKNEFGEVELPEDPEDGLPLPLLRAVEGYVIVGGSELMLSRAQALAEIVQTWYGLGPHPRKTQSWISANMGRDFVSEDVAVPGAVVQTLIEQVLMADADERVLRLECLDDLAAQWQELATDHEKLVGHLVLKHRAAIHWEPGRDLEAHTRLHADLHRRSARTT